ncbi:MAG: serine/threonine protein kinase [Deltaproteobacteria bacterium]|nr:serine/threonine protein kinase [Deltaproteobacteria bacterium]
MILPPPGGDRLTTDQLRQVARIRSVAVAVAILIDVLLVATLRDARFFRLNILDTFAAVNVGLLGVDLIVTLQWLRQGHPRPRLQGLCVLLEAFACTVWIQVTGTVSSYFLLGGFLLLVLYRLFLGYSMGLWSAACVIFLHVGAFSLEELGILRPASLFVADLSALYSQPHFRVGALASIQFCYVLAFFTCGLLGDALRAKEVALLSARQHLQRATTECQPGRLTGHLLAQKYFLGELLGRGGMGEVYQGRRLDDGTDVAVKVLYSHLSETPEILERFRREVQASARLPRSLVAPVLDFGSTATGTHYLVMELLHGEDLGALLRRRGKMPLEEILPLVDQLAMALGAAHGAGVVHRDLKPQNIFISGDGVRLLDFGVSRLQEGTSALTQTAAVLGTPGYLAPEQVASHLGKISARTDVFALGVVVYRALTGQNAFLSQNAAAAVYEAVNVDPPPPSRLVPGLPIQVDYVLTLALAKRPEDRYAGANELARDLHLAAADSLPEPTCQRAGALGSGTRSTTTTLA